MAAYDRVYTSSPVLAMPPQTVHQVPFDRPVLQHQTSSFNQTSPWPHPPLNRTSSFAGRKRSRDEAAVNLDPPEKLVESPVIQEEEEEWIYGPGMTLIKKSTGYVADASSQSGTWVEEKAAEEEARKTEAALLAQEQLAQERPSLRSHKSQRLEMGATTPLAPTDGQQSRTASPARDVTNPLATSSDSLPQPIVDDFTLHLGIGWSRIGDDQHMQAAARGWSRYIENHYPVTDVQIRLESRGLQSYLVQANEGFFLFAENLRQGRLVSKDADRALLNLKSTPPLFDGADTLEAAETPKPVDTFVDSGAASPVLDMDMS